MELPVNIFKALLLSPIMAICLAHPNFQHLFTLNSISHDVPHCEIFRTPHSHPSWIKIFALTFNLHFPLNVRGHVFRCKDNNLIIKSTFKKSVTFCNMGADEKIPGSIPGSAVYFTLILSCVVFGGSICLSQVSTPIVSGFLYVVQSNFLLPPLQ